MRPPPRGVTTTTSTPPLGIELQIQEVARARARVFFQDCVILPGALQGLIYLKRPVCVFADFPKRTEEKPQDGVNPLLGPNFRNIERKR